jgi:acetyl-CoA synthetase
VRLHAVLAPIAADGTCLVWEKRWDQVLDWTGAPFAKWFVGGKLNVA